MHFGLRKAVTGLIFVIGLLSPVGAPLCAELEPGDWLNRMAAAVQTTSYEGTVIRIRDGEVEVLKVVHTVDDGVVHEKVVTQEESGLEIIRVGNEVRSILPHRKSILVEQWGDQSLLFSTLPPSEIRFGNEYDVAIVRNERVAGRETILLAIRPHDGYRYGHRIWLDTETSFPLQTQLIDDNGTAIEELKFAKISLNKEIHASWRNIESLFRHHGADISEGKGSRIRVHLKGVRAVFHRPHPKNETDKGAVKSVRRFLTEAGVMP